MEVRFKVEVPELTKDFQKVITNTTNALGNMVVEQARSTDKFHMGEKFKAGITWTQTQSNAGLVESQVKTDKGVEYSQYMEFGNGPQGSFIYPIRAKALHWESNGEHIFRKWVRTIDQSHLGFMTDAAKTTQEAAPQIWSQEFDKVF